MSLQADHARHLLREMLLIRRFEEKTIELYQAEKIRGFLHVYIGEEAVAVGVMQALTARDAVVATYREHGHALARGIPARAVMAEMFGKTEGCSRGRGGSMHLFDAATRFYGGSAIVGSGLPIGVGVALADKMARRDALTAVFFGEGALGEGEFHEAMNLAALWWLPVLFCCENNYYGMGTPLHRAQSMTDIPRRAASYNIQAESVDGMDVLAVEAAARRAAASIRQTARPFFLELRTYRFRGHSMFDPELYRPRDEVDEWRTRDPIPRLIGEAVTAGALTAADIDEIEAEVAAEIAAAVDFAEAGTLEPVDELTRFVYSEAPDDH